MGNSVLSHPCGGKSAVKEAPKLYQTKDWHKASPQSDNSTPHRTKCGQALQGDKANLAPDYKPQQNPTDRMRDLRSTQGGNSEGAPEAAGSDDHDSRDKVSGRTFTRWR
jgi:hypothetical protein